MCDDLVERHKLTLQVLFLCICIYVYIYIYWWYFLLELKKRDVANNCALATGYISTGHEMLFSLQLNGSQDFPHIDNNCLKPNTPATILRRPSSFGQKSKSEWPTILIKIYTGFQKNPNFCQIFSSVLCWPDDANQNEILRNSMVLWLYQIE